MTDQNEQLHSAVPWATREEWRKHAEVTEPGKPLRTLDQLRRRPQRGSLQWEVLYDATPAAATVASAASVKAPKAATESFSTLSMAQSYLLDDHADPKSFNALLLEDLEGGIHRISLESPPNSPSTAPLVAILKELTDQGSLDTPTPGPFLGGVYTSLVTFELPAAALAAFIDETTPNTQKDAQKDAQSLVNVTPRIGIFDHQKLGTYARTLGNRSWTLNLAELHHCGADIVTELASLLSLVSAIHTLPQGSNVLGHPDGLTVRLGINSSHISSISKIRAARRLWDRLTHDHGLPPSRLWIQGETSRTELSALDTWTNVIRHSAAAAAGLMANCDGLLISPHDARIAKPNPFGHRIARNIMNILTSESKLNAFEDPLAGSFAVESMTAKLVEKAWQMHRDIEQAGGLLADLAHPAGTIAAATIRHRQKLIDEESRRQPGMLGVSEYPNANETQDLMQHEHPEAFVTHVARQQNPSEWQSELVLSDVFGVLRQAAVHHGTQYELILLDPAAAVSARLTWTENALAAAGLRAADPKGTTTTTTTQGATVGVVVGSDSSYKDQKDQFLSTLKNLSTKYQSLVVAGKLPQEIESAALESGMTASIFVGGNLETILRKVLSTVGALP